LEIVGVKLDMNKEDDLFKIGYFKLAKNASKHSTYKIRVGAVISNKKPIAVGFNKKKSHPRFSNPEFNIHSCIHAEASAVINSGRIDLNNYIIYIYREKKNRVPANARPCKECLKLLKEVGIRKIYYSIDEKPFYRMEKI